MSYDLVPQSDRETTSPIEYARQVALIHAIATETGKAIQRNELETREQMLRTERRISEGISDEKMKAEFNRQAAEVRARFSKHIANISDSAMSRLGSRY